MTISSTVEVQSTTITETGSQLGRLLEEYGEIAAILPVLTGLLVTTQLRLRGASALVVNIAIAALTRQIIVQLKKQSGHSAVAPALTAATNGAAGTVQAEDYTIMHSVPGRIRLRIPRLHTEPAFANHLEKLLLTQDIVLGVRLNRAASSIAIRYDGTNLTELDLGMRLLQILEEAEQETPAI